MKSLLAAACALLLVPATASADLVVTYDTGPNWLQIDSTTADEPSDLVVRKTFDTVGGTTNFLIVETSAANISESAAECEETTPETIDCDFANSEFVGKVDAELGPGADVFGVHELSDGFSADVDGGAGHDVLSGSTDSAFDASRDLLFGGDGQDEVSGGAGDDVVNGGPGNGDLVIGGRGSDTLYDSQEETGGLSAAGAGDAVLFTEADRTAGVVVDPTDFGADGTPASYDAPENPVPTGGDNIGSGFERVDGTEFGDDLKADFFGTELNGLGGNDILRGSDGADVLRGGGDNDTINANDGGADIAISCDDGPLDVANVDEIDPPDSALTGCETINPAGRGGDDGGDGGDGGSGGDGGGGGGGGKTTTPGDTTAPDTSISGAEGQIVDVDVPPAVTTYTLSSTEAGSTYECDVNGSGFRSCPSSLRVFGVIGTHRIQARAKDVAGNVDATPATRGFSVRQRPVLRPASRPFDSTDEFVMPRATGLTMEKARGRVLKAAPAAELKFAFKKGCKEASDLEVIGQRPAAGRKITAAVTEDANMTLTVCLAESDWLRDCSQVELADDLDAFEDRDDFELTYDTALKVTKCKVDYDIRLVRGPDEAYLKLKAQRDAARTTRDRAKKARAGEIKAGLDCPIAPEDQDLRVAYGDGYSPGRLDASVGPRENGPGGWQLPAGYKSTFSLTIIDRGLKLVNATTFIDADAVGAANAPKGAVKYTDGRRTISFTPQKPGKVYVCTILETGDERVLTHAFSIDVVKVSSGERWTTAGGRVLQFGPGTAKWLTPQEAGLTARAADVGGFIRWLQALFGGTSHPVAKAVSGEGRISQKNDVVTTQSRVGTAQIPLAGTLAALVQPPRSVIGACLFADTAGKVSIIQCKILVAQDGTAMIATSTDPSAGRIVAAGAGNVLSHNGGQIVAAGAGNFVGVKDGKLIGSDGASLIGADGASLIGADGASLIGSDGASLIGSDGASLSALGASAISIDAAALKNEGGSALSPGVTSALIGADGASLIGADGASLIGSDGASIVAAGAGN